MALLGCASLNGLVHVQEMCRIRVPRLVVARDCDRVPPMRRHRDRAEQHVEELSEDCRVELRECCRTKLRGRCSVVDV